MAKYKRFKDFPKIRIKGERKLSEAHRLGRVGSLHHEIISKVRFSAETPSIQIVLSAFDVGF